MKWTFRRAVLIKNLGAPFVNKNSYLAARIVSCDIAGLRLLTFRILEPYLSKVTELDLNDVIIIALNKSYLNHCFKVSQLLKHDGNILVS